MARRPRRDKADSRSPRGGARGRPGKRGPRRVSPTQAREAERLLADKICATLEGGTRGGAQQKISVRKDSSNPLDSDEYLLAQAVRVLTEAVLDLLGDKSHDDWARVQDKVIDIHSKVCKRIYGASWSQKDDSVQAEAQGPQSAEPAALGSSSCDRDGESRRRQTWRRFYAAEEAVEEPVPEAPVELDQDWEAD